MVEIFCSPFISILMGRPFFKYMFCFSSNSSIPSSKKKESKKRKKPFVVRLSEGDKHQPLLTGPPQTKGFQSGLVVLQPGEDVGKHSTKHYEEALIILEGKGEALSDGNEPLAIEAGCLIYIPPYTEHNIKNTGTTPLKYIYLVAPTN
jgi:mannose-6-phosphate isomerase-like protein (cupin superfamily)